MRLLIMILAFHSNDSVQLKVIKAAYCDTASYYLLKDKWGTIYQTSCNGCVEKHKKGEFVMVSKKDIMFIPKRKQLW